MTIKQVAYILGRLSKVLMKSDYLRAVSGSENKTYNGIINISLSALSNSWIAIHFLYLTFHHRPPSDYRRLRFSLRTDTVDLTN